MAKHEIPKNTAEAHDTWTGSPKQQGRCKILPVWEDMKDLEAQVRVIKECKEEGQEKPDWIAEIGLFESLGEQGGDILTEFFDSNPTKQEVRNAIKENLRETKADLQDSGALSGREEMQLKKLKRLKI